MPYKDHEQKIQHQREWRKKVIGQGYGKWLYARRKLRFEDSENFRWALTDITMAKSLGEAKGIATHALQHSLDAEAKLGHWEAPKTHDG